MTQECPKCDREFANERGVNAHIGHAHPEYKQQSVECHVCGDQKTIPQCQYELSERFFCGQSCRHEFMADHMEGDNNPSYNGGKVTISCERCGEAVKVTPALEDRKRYCSKSCYTKAMSERSGEQTPNYQGGKREIQCEECDSTFAVKKAREDIATYCSRECMGSAYERLRRGEGSPSWAGGAVDYYGPNWDEQRRRALDRDGYSCQDCGVSREEFDWIDVHHIFPIKRFISETHADYESANRLGNLITLCRGCHKKWETMTGLQPDNR